MNIKEVYRGLTVALPNLQLKKYVYDNNPSYDYIFYDLDKYRAAVRTVMLASGFLLTDQLEKSLLPVLAYDNDTLSIYKKDGDVIMSNADRLFVQVKNFISYVSGITVNEIKESSIDIKFIKIDTLEELEKTANLLRRSFNTPVFELEGQIAVENIENGSVWITLGIIGATSLALKMCANLIWAAVAIHNKSKEATIHEEHARTIRLKNDLIEALVQQQKDYIEQSKETEAKAIINEFIPQKNSPEVVGQFINSIESIGLLIEKGAQFYPSLKAPEDVKELFPDFNIMGLIESKVKMLGEGDK